MLYVEAAWPTVSSTVLFGVLAVLYGPIGSSVRTVVLVKDSSTVRSSSTAARALYRQYRSSDWLLGSSSSVGSEGATGGVSYFSAFLTKLSRSRSELFTTPR